MFGYVVLNREELKFKDYELYRSYYCGLCRELRERYGLAGQFSLTYDMTFVILLLTGLYEPRVQKGSTRCIIQPVKRHTVRRNRFTGYAADLNVILTYYKCRDDWQDEHSPLRLAYAKLLERDIKRLGTAYEEKIGRITAALDELSRLEKENCRNLDKVAGQSGRLLAEVFSREQDQWSEPLRRMGFYLGKYIYLLDAYEDVEKDLRSGSYNPFSEEYRENWNTPEFDQKVKDLLTMMLTGACQEFERLPVLRCSELLRNILYSGVWSRYEMVRKKRVKERGR